MHIQATLTDCQMPICSQVTAGANAVDASLGGGMKTGSITEVYGKYWSGKIQVRARKKESGSG